MLHVITTSNETVGNIYKINQGCRCSPYQCARASNGSDATETSLSIFICWAALNELSLTALVAGCSKCLLQTTSRLQLSISVSNGKKKGRSWSSCGHDHLSNHFHWNKHFTTTKFSFRRGERRRVAWTCTNSWCWQSVISHSLLKLFKIQSSKAYKKK